MGAPKEKYKFISLMIEVCGCGNHCKHCYIPDHAKRFKPLEEVKAIIDNYAEVLNEPAITESALLYLHDEPTLYPKLLELWRYGYEKGVKPVPTLSTNGFGIVKRKEGEEILAAFKAYGGRGLNMALYGEREYHDWFAGFKGSYDTRREAARKAKVHGFWIHWNIYLTKENIDQIIRLLDELTEDYKDIGGPNFTLKWESWADLHITQKEMDRIPEEYRKFTAEQKWPKYAPKSEAEWVRIALSGEDLTLYTKEDEIPNAWAMDIGGDLFDCEPCLPMFKLGNLKTNSLREIFANGKQSAGWCTLMNTDLALLARKVGDPHNGRLYHFEAIRLKWFLILNATNIK